MKKTGKRAIERLLGQLLRGAEGTRPYEQLQTSADRAALRTLLRLNGKRQLRRARAPRAKPNLPALAGSSGGTDLAAPLREAARDVTELIHLTRWAFVRGGYETAAALAADIGPRLAELDAEARHAALSLLSEIAISRGEEATARTLWQAHGNQPPAHIRLRLAPDGLREFTPSDAWPRHAAPNLYLASALASAGRLDADEAAERVLERPLVWLQNPELDLLLQQLAPDPHDVRALSRYLSRLGLARCFRAKRDASLLADLRFAPLLWSTNGPLLSVLMAAKNASPTLLYAVDSILRQTYSNLELLIADDASTDDSLALLRQRYAGNPRIRLFRSPRSQGPYNLRNALLEQARGHFVTFHDADDISLPSRFTRQVAALERTGQVACVGSWLRVRSDGSPVFFADGHATRLSMVSLLATRAALQTVGPYPSARFGADLDIARRLSQRYGELPRLREPVLLGLWSSQSLTRSHNAEAFESGYRAEGRRRYSELVFQRDVLGPGALSPEQLEQALRDMGNLLEPAPVEPL